MITHEYKKENVLVLEIAGELMGGEGMKDIQQRIQSALKGNDIHLVIDMAHVKWMNSSGLGILIALLTQLRSADGDLKLACLTERVRRPIELSRLDQVFEMFASVDEAVASYD